MNYTPRKPATEKEEISNVLTWVNKNWILTDFEKEYVIAFLKDPVTHPLGKNGFVPAMHKKMRKENERTFYWCDVTIHLDNFRALKHEETK